MKIVLCPRLIQGVPVEKIKSNEMASKNRQKWNYSIEKETKDVYPNEWNDNYYPYRATCFQNFEH